MALLLPALPLHAGWDALAALKAKGARVSAAVVDLDKGVTLSVLDAEQRLIPASLTKLVLAAAALETWPVDKTFPTRLLGTGTLHDGVLDGDLYVHSAGNATLEHRDLWLLGAQLRMAGVRSVNGRLVVLSAPFGRLECETRDRCDAVSARSRSAYDAPLAAFGVDYGTWCVDVRAAQPGSPAAIMSCAAVDVPIPLRGTIQTVAPPRRSSLWMDRVTSAHESTLDMGGIINAGGAHRLYRSMADPALGAGMLLQQVMRELGIDLRGTVHISDEAVPRNATTLAETNSLPLREQVTRLLRFSNNFISDVLTLALYTERAPGMPVTLTDASALLGDVVVRAHQARGRSDATPPSMLSGSGLTPENKLSADDLVAVLEHQYLSPHTFPVFYGGLVVPGDSPARSLRSRDSRWQNRVAVKTGTLTEPHSAFGLAGYIRKRDGGWMAFAAIVNGTEKRRNIPMREALQAIQTDVNRLMAQY